MGVHRYNHNLETARSYFPNVVTTHTWEERLETLRLVRDGGHGGVLRRDHRDGGDASSSAPSSPRSSPRVEPDEVPLNFLNPRPGTPLGDREPLDGADALRTVAAFRLAMPRTVLRFAGGREITLGDLGARQGLLGGINAVIVGNYLTTLGAPGRVRHRPAGRAADADQGAERDAVSASVLRPLRASRGVHPACQAQRAYEPPRFCPQCARRMVVQVTPTGWTARCSRHGERPIEQGESGVRARRVERSWIDWTSVWEDDVATTRRSPSCWPARSRGRARRSVASRAGRARGRSCGSSAGRTGGSVAHAAVLRRFLQVDGRAAARRRRRAGRGRPGAPRHRPRRCALARSPGGALRARHAVRLPDLRRAGGGLLRPRRLGRGCPAPPAWSARTGGCRCTAGCRWCWRWPRRSTRGRRAGSTATGGRSDPIIAAACWAPWRTGGRCCGRWSRPG